MVQRGPDPAAQTAAVARAISRAGGRDRQPAGHRRQARRQERPAAARANNHALWGSANWKAAPPRTPSGRRLTAPPRPVAGGDRRPGRGVRRPLDVGAGHGRSPRRLLPGGEHGQPVPAGRACRTRSGPRLAGWCSAPGDLPPARPPPALAGGWTPARRGRLYGACMSLSPRSRPADDRAGRRSVVDNPIGVCRGSLVTRRPAARATTPGRVRRGRGGRRWRSGPARSPAASRSPPAQVVHLRPAAGARVPAGRPVPAPTRSATCCRRRTIPPCLPVAAGLRRSWRYRLYEIDRLINRDPGLPGRWPTDLRDLLAGLVLARPPSPRRGRPSAPRRLSWWPGLHPDLRNRPAPVPGGPADRRRPQAPARRRADRAGRRRGRLRRPGPLHPPVQAPRGHATGPLRPVGRRPADRREQLAVDGRPSRRRPGRR